MPESFWSLQITDQVLPCSVSQGIVDFGAANFQDFGHDDPAEAAANTENYKNIKALRWRSFPSSNEAANAASLVYPAANASW